MNLKRRSKVSTEFSMASMSDMIFLLLIFFVLTSTLVSPNGIKVVLPKLNNKKPSKESVTIGINDKHEVYINKDITTIDRLPSQIQSELKGVDNPTVAIAADKTVPYEEVMQLIKVANDLKYPILLKTERE